METIKNGVLVKISKETWSFIIGGVIGAAIFLFIYGTRVLDVTYDDWLFFGENQTDLIQHYMGWVSYRKSAWHFPVGLVEDILYPNLISVAYTDSVPLFAVFFKILSPLLPETFQYFGLFGITVSFLLGAFSARMVCELTGMLPYAVMASVFFSFSMVFELRMFYHTALAAQWIVVASLWVWICREKKWGLKENVLAWSVLSAIGILTEPYFMPMIWGIMFCSLLSKVIREGWSKQSVKECAWIVGVAGVVVVIVAYVIGIFYGNISSGTVGYGVFSMNYNTFFNNRYMTKHSIFPSLKEPEWLNGAQYEGYAYLGMGIFFLLFVIFIWEVVKQKGKDFKRLKMPVAIPYIIFFCCFLLYAASNIGAIGEQVIYNIPLPGRILGLCSKFRTSGRMVWPVYYFIVSFACVCITKIHLNRKVVYGLLVCALVLQGIEGVPNMMERRMHYEQEYSYQTPLKNEAWKEIAADYRHIMVYPATVSMLSFLPGEDLWRYAVENDLSMNIVYLGRDMSVQVDQAVNRWFDEHEPQDAPDTVYYFLWRNPPEDKELYLYDIDGFMIGTPKPLKSIEPMQQTSNE